jgi:ribosome recycling factor
MIDVKETLMEAEEQMEMAAMYLDESLAKIRAGRANVAIVSGVRVESYGMMVPLNQVASVTTPDARTIAIKPFDKKQIREIEKGIMDSDVGITPEERRRDLVKQCNKIGEKAKVGVRNARAEIKDKLKKAIKDGLSEDVEKDAENDLQKLHDKYIAKIDAMLDDKTKEIMTV